MEGGGQPVNTDNPYLFVTGCTRSGTTLLQRMLNGHPRLAVSNDTHIVPRSILKLRPRLDLALTDEIVDDVIGYKYFGELGIGVPLARQLADSCESFVEFAQALFNEFARGEGKPLAGEKDPEYVRRLPMLHALFPGARLLHIVRDGRDVALSMLDWVTPSRYLGRLALWREEPLAVCALWWRRQVSAGQRGSKRVGADHCLEIRYEELVDSPEATLRSVAEFLELPFDPGMLDFHRDRTIRDPRLSSKDQWLPPTSGLRDWRVCLAPRDLQLFEALAGDLLASLGYPLATNHEIPGDVMVVAERCRQWWDAEIKSANSTSGRIAARARS